MGYEYIIEIKNNELEGLEELLLRQEHFETVEIYEKTKSFEYRLPDNSDSMPDATIGLDGSNTIVFCDNGQGIDILKNLLIELLWEYGKVEITNDSA